MHLNMVSRMGPPGSSIFGTAAPLNKKKKSLSCLRLVALLFFPPPVWPIRTRHGPYNSVSGEKHLEKGLVWSKNAGKSSHQHKQKTKSPSDSTKNETVKSQNQQQRLTHARIPARGKRRSRRVLDDAHLRTVHRQLGADRFPPGYGAVILMW